MKLLLAFAALAWRVWTLEERVSDLETMLDDLELEGQSCHSLKNS